MSRRENEDVSHLDLPDPTQTEATYYIGTGEAIDRDDFLNMEDQPLVCAKEVTHLETKITTYFVLCANTGQMFDPRDTDPRYRSRNVWKFRRATRTTFDIYLKFLVHKYTSMLSQAQRSM
jgi:hypothetical protein